jgi:hypothetical protein
MMATSEISRPAPSDTKSRKKSPRERARFWSDELKSSQKMLRKCHRQGVKVVRRFIDDRDAGGVGIDTADGQFRLNLFNANIRTMQDMLYSSLPKVETSRTNADANDDVARVAAEMIERLLNLDISDNGQDYDSVLRSCLQDRLLPGLGCARVRYEVEMEEYEVEAQVDELGNVIMAAYIDTRVKFEDAPVDYTYWQDVAWGWARNFSEIPWLGFRSFLSQDEVVERFGAKFKDKVTYKKQKMAEGKDESSRPDDDSPWMKAEIWELWDKEMGQVVWYSQGCPQLLDRRPDPLQLRQFFPCPPFLLANPTTSLYRPVSDFHMSQDLYNEVDALQTRISILTTAVKAVGVYDASAEGVKRMFKEGFENDLIPVDSWAMFAEAGGIKGAVDWMPIGDIVGALDKLRDLRDDTISLLQRISGMADVMQGGLQNQYEGVGQTQIKAQFGSVSVQALQDSFANFAGELLQLKAEVICRHFQPETIVKMSNMEFSMDQELLQPAVELLKQPDMAHIRIKVRPEQVAMVDYARLKVERTEFLNAMATFMQSAGPMLEQEPGSMPFMLQMLQWTMSGFKGSSEIEGVLDKAVDAAQQKLQEAAQNPPEDPAAAEAAAAQQQAQEKLQGEMQKIQAKAQSDMQLRQQDMQADIQTTAAASQAKTSEIVAQHQSAMALIQAKLQADLATEKASVEGNLRQTTTAARTEMEKDALSADLDMEKETHKADLAIETEGEKTTQEIIKGSLASQNKLQEMSMQDTIKGEDSDGD